MTVRRRRWSLLGVAIPLAVMALPGLGTSLPARASTQGATGDVPYALPVALPGAVSSPPVDPAAPYTPLVRSLIAQLEPSSPPTATQIANAAKLFQGEIGALAGVSTCNAVGAVVAPTGTTPGIEPMCWADSVGVNITGGANAGHTTATAEPLAIGATFDPALANVWGQVEGLEGRQLMVTGLYGPEADVSIQPNWERGLDTLGEDPYVNEVMTAAQVNGTQGRGLMAQIKHFAAFSGADRYTLTQVQDQAFHEMLLTPFEAAFTDAQAASTMCAYEQYQDVSHHLPGPQSALAVGTSPYASGTAPTTWPLDGAFWACEQPLALDYVLRGLWHSTAFVGSDYPATHSTSAMTQGESQEFFLPYFFANTDPSAVAPPLVTVGRGDDMTGDTCAIAQVPADCTSTGAQHIGGIPGPGCAGPEGCGLVDAVVTGNLPLSVFNQALAEILYEEQRFGILGCDDTPRAATCTNPGGVGGVRTGAAPIPAGATQGAAPAVGLGTENADAAVVERTAEEGAVLLKDDASALPLTPADLAGGVSVTGPGAEYLIAAPSNEASTGFPDRIAIDPLLQLRTLSSAPTAFTYTAAQGPTGEPVPSSELSASNSAAGGGLPRTAGPGAPATDPTIDFTTASSAGPLSPGDYTWSGYIDVPRADSYTFRFQSTPGTASTPNSPITFSLDGNSQSLSAASSFYCGQYYGHNICVPVSPTNAGYTQAGLTNQQTAAAALTAGFHAVSITFRNDTVQPASFRFAYSRAQGDVIDAAAAARGKAAAVVFVNDDGVAVTNQDAYTDPAQGVATLPDADVALINAVAAVNPNTIVVMNTADPVVVKPWIDNPNVKAVLEMWNAGQEGGTATARLLLGQADPSGHTPMTWPQRSSDTMWSYNETVPLYPGEQAGAHGERLNGLTDSSAADCASYIPAPSPCTMTSLTEGIFSGYRYYDQEGITPQYPFGYGLSYTTFGFADASLVPAGDGLDVSFDVTNTGRVAGDEVAQVYVGAGPAATGVQQAVRSLRGFARVTLSAGQTSRQTVHLDARSFQYWDEVNQRWSTNAGPRSIWVGDADLPSRLLLVQVAAAASPAASAPATLTNTAGDRPEAARVSLVALLALTLAVVLGARISRRRARR